MAFNFSGLAALLPGYMEGYEKAVRSNYQDMKDYNQVDEGQKNNLYLAGTMRNRIANSNYQTAINQLTAERAALDQGQYMASLPGMMAYRQAFSDFAPTLSEMQYLMQLRQANMLFQNPWLAFGGNFANAGRVPSTIG